MCLLIFKVCFSSFHFLSYETLATLNSGGSLDCPLQRGMAAVFSRVSCASCLRASGGRDPPKGVLSTGSFSLLSQSIAFHHRVLFAFVLNFHPSALNIEDSLCGSGIPHLLGIITFSPPIV